MVAKPGGRGLSRLSVAQLREPRPRPRRWIVAAVHLPSIPSAASQMPSPLLLLALTSASVSLGISAAGYHATNGLLKAELSPSQIQAWWKSQLRPSVGGLVFLGLAAGGLGAAELSVGRAAVQGSVRMLGMGRRGWVMAGTLFSFGHFVFGGLVVSVQSISLAVNVLLPR